MSVLLWTAPLVAAVVALVVLLTQMRRLEDLSVGLATEVRRLGELREPLVALRQELDRSESPVDTVWRHWAGAESADEPV